MPAWRDRAQAPTAGSFASVVWLPLSTVFPAPCASYAQYKTPRASCALFRCPRSRIGFRVLLARGVPVTRTRRKPVSAANSVNSNKNENRGEEGLSNVNNGLLRPLLVTTASKLVALRATSIDRESGPLCKWNHALTRQSGQFEAIWGPAGPIERRSTVQSRVPYVGTDHLHASVPFS